MPNNLSKEEVNDIIQWDVKNWKNAIPFWESHFDIKPGMRVLALGERGGGISVYFALKGCTVVCTDYIVIPEIAKALHKKYGLENKISYDQVDMRKIQFENESFDIVVFKSVIGALGDPKDQEVAIGEIERVLKPGGAFLFAENTTASKLHRYMRRKFVTWQAKWHYGTDAEFDAWKNKFKSGYSKKIGFTAVFGRSERQRKVLGAIDFATIKLVPKKWRYIYLGVFKK